MNANAKEYLPMFARKKVTKKQMDAMTHDELDSVRQLHLFRIHIYPVEYELVAYITMNSFSSAHSL